MSWFSRGPKVPRINPEVEAKSNIFLLQREEEDFTEKDVRAAAERAWKCGFPGGEQAPDWFVFGDPASAVSTVACGSHRLFFGQQRHPEWDDDDASDVLPALASRAEWAQYKSRIGIEFAFTLKPTSTPVRQAYVARMALEWLSPNIVGIYHSFPGRYLPVSEAAIEELRALAANCPDETSSVPA